MKVCLNQLPHMLRHKRVNDAIKDMINTKHCLKQPLNAMLELSYCLPVGWLSWAVLVSLAPPRDVFEGGRETFSPRSVLLARVSDSIGKRVRQSRLPECSPKRSSFSLTVTGQRTSQCSRSWSSSPQRLHVGEVLGSIRFLYARSPT